MSRGGMMSAGEGMGRPLDGHDEVLAHGDGEDGGIGQSPHYVEVPVGVADAAREAAAQARVDDAALDAVAQLVSLPGARPAEVLAAIARIVRRTGREVLDV